MARRICCLATLLLALTVLNVQSAFAAFTLGGDFYTEINGLWSDPVGLTFGTYLQGSSDDGWNYLPTTYNYTSGSTGVGNGNARDYYWVHDTDVSSAFYDDEGILSNHPDFGLWFDLGGQANKCVVFGCIDHGPLPEEALEHTVYLSDDKVNWTRAKLETAYTEGWDANPNIADGYAGVYSLASSQTFRYASVVWGGASALQADYDTEIDAVAGLTEQGQAIVPEPGTLGLMGIGLAGLVARLRRRR